MKSKAKPSFWQCFHALPEDVRRRAKRAYVLWSNDPAHPGIEFKRVSRNRPVYSARVDGHRVVGLLEDDTVIWFWIGKHDEYERLLRKFQ